MVLRKQPVRIPLVFLALATLLFLSACRARPEGNPDGPSPSAAPSASAQPRGPLMPAGMLANRPDGALAPLPATDFIKDKLEFARGKTGGEWAELQIAGPDERKDRTKFERWRPDSRFLSMDAMTLLYDPFLRAQPGFDLLLPRFFDTAGLGRLQTELAKFATELAGMTRSTAIQRWSGSSDLVRGLRDEAAWFEARGLLVATLGELGRYLKAIEAKKGTMWVIVM